MVIIGFTGKMGSGKNYIAEQILLPFLTSHGYQVLTLAFADQLKIDCMTKYGLNYNDVFKDKSPATRAILQQEGTENGRNTRGADIWIKYVASWVQIFSARGIEHFLIPDVRFQNEAEWILQQGGILVKIDANDRHQHHCATRGISSERQQHSSETDLDSFDHYDIIIDNRISNQENVKQQTLDVFNSKIINLKHG